MCWTMRGCARHPITPRYQTPPLPTLPHIQFHAAACDASWFNAVSCVVLLQFFSSRAMLQEYKKLCTRMGELEKRRDQLDAQVVALAQSSTDLAALERTSTELGKARIGAVSNAVKWND